MANLLPLGDIGLIDLDARELGYLAHFSIPFQ
jgi:hypothetical protein